MNAASEKVWSILTNFDNYPNWNLFIKSIKGEVRVGNIITERIEPPKSKGMTFRPKILKYETNRELRWLGQLLFGGIFDGEHKFELIDNRNGTITFRQSEKLKEYLCLFLKNNLTTIPKTGLEK